MGASPHLTDCGLPGIQRIPYGLHACHFYSDRQQLAEALVPYFLAGLRRNERCLWITSAPLPAAEAVRALAASWDEVGGAMASRALRIIDYDDWYADAAGLKGTDVVEFWLEEEKRALAEGYEGLRITGNTSFLHQREWATFMEYERKAGSHFYGRRIVALCSYALSSCSAQQVMDVRRTHDCVFERPDSSWQVVAPQDARDWLA